MNEFFYKHINANHFQPEPLSKVILTSEIFLMFQSWLWRLSVSYTSFTYWSSRSSFFFAELNNRKVSNKTTKELIIIHKNIFIAMHHL